MSRKACFSSLKFKNISVAMMIMILLLMTGRMTRIQSRKDQKLWRSNKKLVSLSLPKFQNVLLPLSYFSLSDDAVLLLVNCPTIWSLLFIFGFLCCSSSWRWQPHIGVCRLLWPLLRAQMAVLTQFFCKMYFLYVSRSRKKNLGNIFLRFPTEKKSFFVGGPWFARFPEIRCSHRIPGNDYLL